MNNWLHCTGNRNKGKRHPNAATLTIATRHQASKTPKGMANRAVKAARDRDFPSSSNARDFRVMPMAHSGASWGSLIWLSDNRLANMAIPATSNVRLLSARVMAKVFSKTLME